MALKSVVCGAFQILAGTCHSPGHGGQAPAWRALSTGSCGLPPTCIFLSTDDADRCIQISRSCREPPLEGLTASSWPPSHPHPRHTSAISIPRSPELGRLRNPQEVARPVPGEAGGHPAPSDSGDGNVALPPSQVPEVSWIPGLLGDWASLLRNYVFIFMCIRKKKSAHQTYDFTENNVKKTKI